MSRTTPFAALACVACLGCGGTDPSKQIETLQSWRATIDLATEARVKGWVTPRYVKQLRDEARLAVTAGDKAMSKAKPAERDSLSAAGRDLRVSLARLDRAGP
jgi:hypothetical protein